MCDKKSMKNANQYVRRTVSLSPQIDELLTEGARKEFSGNLSAFLAHIALDYMRCKKCTRQNVQKNKCESKKTQ